MKRNLQILIVEDELMIAQMTKEMLLELNYQVVGIAKNQKEALAYLEQKGLVEMVILDINLNDVESGIEIAKVINSDFKIPFIYLTSYSDPSTIKNAAATEPAAYLIKPFSSGDLHATIEIIRSKHSQSDKTIMVRQNDLNIKIQVNDILFVKSDNNYIEIFSEKKKYVERSSLDNFLDNIDEANFIRVHRSYVVNMSKINAINGQTVVIQTHRIPLSRSLKKVLLDKFTN